MIACWRRSSMCIHLSSEIVLANLLVYSSKSKIGIDYDDIEEYCNRVQAELLKNTVAKSVSFLINSKELEINLRTYPNCFKRFMGKYYRGINLKDTKAFEELNSKAINDILRLIAQSM